MANTGVVSKDNPTNQPPQFLAAFLETHGYLTLPTISDRLGVSRSWLYKMVKGGKLRGRVEDKPRVLVTGNVTVACYWLLVSEVEQLARKRISKEG